MNTLYIVVGNIGAGKSTAMPLIAEALDAEMVSADEVFQVSPFRDRYLEDIHRWGLTSELWVMDERRKITEEAMKTLPNRNVVIDGGLLLSWIYTRSHILVGNITEDEWELFDRSFQVATRNVFDNLHVIHFACPYEVLLERIKIRGRDYELKFYTREYLEQLEKSMVELMSLLKADNVPVTTVQSHQTGNLLKSKKDKRAFIEKLQ